MINTQVWVYGISSLGSGDYSFQIYFESGLFAYLNIGDIVTDSIGNRYNIIDATLPFSNEGLVTAHYLTIDTAPVEDTGPNSHIDTDTFNPLPVYRTVGYLYEIGIYNPTNYEYTAKFYPTDPGVAGQAIVGDSFVDLGGKEFVITFLPTGKFDDVDPIRVREVELQGILPVEGDGTTLYRSTSVNKFFQGTELTDPARNVIQGRDIKKIDLLLSTGSGSTGPTGSQGPMGNQGPTGSTGVDLTPLVYVSEYKAFEVE